MIANNVKRVSLSLMACVFLGACSMLPYKENFSCEKGKSNGMCGSVTEIYDLSGDMDELRKKADKNHKKSLPKVEQTQKAKLKAEQEAKDNFRALKLQEMLEAVEIRKIQNQIPTIFVYYPNKKEDSKTQATVEKHSTDKTREDASKKNNKNVKNHPKTGKNTKTNNLAEVNKLYDNLKIHDSNQSANNSTSSKNNHSSLDTISSVQNPDKNQTNQDLNGVRDDLILKNYPANSDSKMVPIDGRVKVSIPYANIRELPSCEAPILRVANKGEELDALYEQDGWIKLKDGAYVQKSIVTRD